MRDQQNDARDARRAISKLLLDPVQQALAGTSRWLIVPDGSLWGVPFAALPDPEQPDRYLVERVTSGTLTSIYELAEYGDAKTGETESWQSTGDGSGMTALLFGAPEFGQATPGQGPVVLTAAGPCRLDPFEPLPGTVQELNEIRELLPGSTLVSGSDAVKQRLYRELENRPAIVHFATHAYFAGGGGCEGTVAQTDENRLGISTALVPNPLLLSGIVLAGANAPQRLTAEAGEEATSGILTALEAAGLDLSFARMVVLSACVGAFARPAQDPW
jgi:CHAT domain-containing protein